MKYFIFHTVSLAFLLAVFQVGANTPHFIASSTHDQTAEVIIDSSPGGAVVRVSKSKNQPGKYVGTTPVTLTLPQGRHYVHLHLPGHLDASLTLDLITPQKQILNVPLRKGTLYERNRLMGHSMFWPGISFVAFGFIARMNAIPDEQPLHYEMDYNEIQRSREWTGVMLASWGLGSVLTISGIYFWVRAAKQKHHRETANRFPQVAVAPLLSGGAMAGISGSF